MQNGFMFNFVPIFIGIIFIIVIGSILFRIFNGIKTWRKNEQSPKLSVPARIVSKRTDVHHSGSMHDQHHMSHTHTNYFVTFEFESKDRLEFDITGEEYGMLAEEDAGILSFQGTRFLDFVRK